MKGNIAAHRVAPASHPYEVCSWDLGRHRRPSERGKELRLLAEVLAFEERWTEVLGRPVCFFARLLGAANIPV